LPNGCDLAWNFFQGLFEALVQPLLCGTVKTFSAEAARRPPWQNPQRLRQVAAGAGVLLLLYVVLFLTALAGGPRIGASFLPLPGGGPDPASPVAGLEPGQPTQNVPAIPRGTTPTPGSPVTAPPTPLPTATTPGSGATTALVPGATTPCPTPTPGQPTTQIVDRIEPTIPGATKTPPASTTEPHPPTGPTTAPPGTQPTSPPTSTTPTTPPTTTENPDPPSLGGLLNTLLNKLGL
jgi:hypothetical protein